MSNGNWVKNEVMFYVKVAALIVAVLVLMFVVCTGCAGGGRIEDSPNSDSRGMGIDTLSPKRGDVEEKHATSQPTAVHQGPASSAVVENVVQAPKADQQGIGNLAFTVVGGGATALTLLWLLNARDQRKIQLETDKAEMASDEKRHAETVAALRALAERGMDVAMYAMQTGPREAA